MLQNAPFWPNAMQKLSVRLGYENMHFLKMNEMNSTANNDVLVYQMEAQMHSN